MKLQSRKNRVEALPKLIESMMAGSVATHGKIRTTWLNNAIAARSKHQKIIEREESNVQK